MAVLRIGSISAALSFMVYPPREGGAGRSASSFPEQRLVIEPILRTVAHPVRLTNANAALAPLMLTFGMLINVHPSINANYLIT